VLSLCVPSFKLQLLAEALHKVEVRLLEEWLQIT
jgi:hypothetical protein